MSDKKNTETQPKQTRRRSVSSLRESIERQLAELNKRIKEEAPAVGKYILEELKSVDGKSPINTLTDFKKRETDLEDKIKKQGQRITDLLLTIKAREERIKSLEEAFEANRTQQGMGGKQVPPNTNSHTVNKNQLSR